MKKNILLITLIVLLGCFLFVSCDSEAAAPQTDELVKVSFVESTSKALTQNIPAFDVASHYWKYTAVKKDGSSLTTGATGADHNVAQAQWVALDSNNSPKQGLSENNTPYQVINFSRGLWEFKLYGYSDAAGTKLVYTGTSSIVTLTQDYHQVSVNVSKDKTSGTGTLVIDKGITITNENTIYANLSSGVARNYAVYSWNGSEWSSAAVNSGVIGSEDVTVSNLTAGDYKIIITYTDGTYTYGSGSATFVIYSNVTTTITGSVNETTTYAEFEATSNVINETASSKSFDSGTTSTTNTVEIKYETEQSVVTDTVVQTVTAEVPLTAAKTLLSKVVEANDSIQADTESGDTTIKNEMVLTLAVSTESSTENSATYNIDMNYVLTNTVTTGSSDPVVTQVNGQVSTLDQYTTVMVKLPANLENVQFLHSNLTMQKTNSGNAIDSLTALNAIGSTVTADETAVNNVYPGYMWYDATTGSAYLRTKSFSPFSVTYEVPSYVAAIGTTFYTTLKAAFDAASDGDTVVLLKSIDISNPVILNSNKIVAFSLNGYKLTGIENVEKVFDVENGKLTIDGIKTNSGIDAAKIAVFVAEGAELVVNGGTYSNTVSDCIFDVEGNALIEGVTLGPIVKGIRAKGSNARVTVNNSTAIVAPTYGLFNAKGGSLTIDGGSYTTAYSDAKYHQMIDIKENGSVTIIDGDFSTNLDGYSSKGIPELVVFNSGNSLNGTGDRLEIKGGTFSYPRNLAYLHGSANSKVSISGGTFNVNPDSYYSNEDSLVVINNGSDIYSNPNSYKLDYSITGGTFNIDPTNTGYVADGYYVKTNSNTTWSVLANPTTAPVAIVELILNPENYATNGAEIAGKAVNTGVLVSFKPKADPVSYNYEESEIEAFYKDWNADFRITALSNLEAESCGIVGHYFNYPWISMELPSYANVNDHYMLMGNWNFNIPYSSLLECCKTGYDKDGVRSTFNCGAYWLSTVTPTEKQIKVELILWRGEGTSYEEVVCQLESVSGTTDASQYIQNNSVVCTFHSDSGVWVAGPSSMPQQDIIWG